MNNFNIKTNKINSKSELKSTYDRLINNKNMYVDISTNLFLNTKFLPESITISKGEDIIDDLYYCDKKQRKNYQSIIDSARNNNASQDTAFHYGASNAQINSADIISSIENNNKKYFMTVFVYDSKNEKTYSYQVKI